MPATFTFGDVHLDVSTRRQEVSAPDRETPFRIAILGDFSGRESRGVIETGRRLSARRPLCVDRNDINAAMEKLRVEVELPVAGAIRFRELEDFHPDRLYASLDFFAKLRQARDEAGCPGPPPRTAAAAPSVRGRAESRVERVAGAGDGRDGQPQ